MEVVPLHLIALALLLVALLLLLWAFAFHLLGLVIPAILLGLIGAAFESAAAA